MLSISSFGCVGFSGSRSLSGVSVPVLRSSCGLVGSGSVVGVGCARGVDQFVRSAFPSAVVFSASSFGVGRSSFARRSVALVQWVAASGSGCWVSFPSGACPAQLSPSAVASRCFSGSGSGSWASLAFAAGSGVPCFVFLGSVPAPRWLVSVGCGWFQFRPAPPQLSLF